MNRGWRGESHRHYLAAKGVKTSHKYSPRFYAAKLQESDEEWAKRVGYVKINPLIPETVTRKDSLRKISRLSDADQERWIKTEQQDLKKAEEFASDIRELNELDPEYTKEEFKQYSGLYQKQKREDREYMSGRILFGAGVG